MKNYIEQDCTVVHEGKSFTAGSASVSPEYLMAYPGENGILCDWHGNKIGTYQIVSKWRAIFFGHTSWQGDYMYAMRATVGAQQYSLRGFGVNMLARGKAIKTK